MKRSAIDSGAHDMSLLGFRAQEDLGGGNKAGVYLEYGLSADSNSGVGVTQFGSRSLARNQFVFLSGDFGYLSAGRVGSPLAYLQNYDAGGSSSFSPLLVLLASTANYGADFTRLSNAVRYTSPNRNGFTAMVAYGFAAFGADTTAYRHEQERIAAAHVSYQSGKLSLLVAHQRTGERATTPTADLHDSGVGVSYDFGTFKLMGLALAARRGGTAGPHSLNQWLLGTTVPVGARGLLRVQGGRLHDLSLAAADATSWMLGYDYSLSKRTLIYTALNHTGNDATVRYAADTFNRPTAGGSARLFGLGVRHNF